MKHVIRLGTGDDCEAILGIYSFYIENTAFSFEVEVPLIADFRNRIEGIAEKYPYLVYTIDDDIVGYAYAARFGERAAYYYDVTVSIYVMREYHGSGIATKLYTCLFNILSKQGFYNAYAGITVPNEKSKKFHEKFGFTEVGTYHKTGYKFGKWHDLTYMEKILKSHDDYPEKVKAIGELPEVFLSDIFLKSGKASN